MADALARMMVSDKAMRMMGYLTAALVVAMMVLLGMSIPNISENTQASRRTDDLASCRASYRAEIDDADFAVTVALGEAQTALSKGVVASIRQDPTTLALVAAELETAEEHKVEAYAALEDANATYDEAVTLSREDPDQFLDDCKDRP